MRQEIDALRTEIDAVDSQLVSLLARRKALVAKVGETKARDGLPVYVPEREAALIKARRKQAESAGINPDLMEDVLRRIIRESYQAEGRKGFKMTKADLGPAVVIGGGNGMGALFTELLKGSGYHVRILEKDDWHQADTILGDAELVVVSVPIHLTETVIEQLKGKLQNHCLLCDVTSVKAAPLRKMLTVHNGPVVGLHPMFGPKTTSLAKQLVIVCDGRGATEYQWLLDQIRLWGAKTLNADPEKHDHMMGVIQAMRHFATYVFGVHLYREGVEIEDLITFSSPIYRLELGMVGRLFAQDPKLYADIIFSSVEGSEIASRYFRRYGRELDILMEGDKQAFIERFEEVKAYFGDYGSQLFEESSFMLEKVYEKFGSP